METIKLPPGEIAPKDSDCIKITRSGNGFTLETSALVQCEDVDEAESEAVIASESYPTYEEAEQAGLAWARGCCVTQVYIETA